jgi:hypothetical protein
VRRKTVDAIYVSTPYPSHDVVSLMFASDEQVACPGKICPTCGHRKCMCKCRTVHLTNAKDLSMKRSDSNKLKKKTPVVMAF